MGNSNSASNSTGADQAALEARLETLEHRRDLLQDLNAVKRLQRAYGYFIDRGMWDQASQLFASDGTIEIGLDGVYVGQKRVSEYLHALLGGGKSGTLAPGQLNEHMQLMPYVTVAPDGHTARGTWRDVILAGKLGSSATWGEGPYENEYVKENGVWKIKSLHWFQTLTVPYDGGWAKHEDVNGGKYVSSRLPPDRPPTIQYRTWPGGLLPPFHFDHPAAGGTTGSAPADTVPNSNTSKGALAARVAVLMHDAQLLRDQDDIENLQRIYGYYVDKQLWTQAADLFTDDVQYEIAGRGTYVGKAAASAYLHAIGPESPQTGRLYDQMQLQPIVNVDADGKTAQGRWRVFIQAAQAGKFHEWGMQIAENQYRQEAGVWKISRVTLYPVMFTPFDAGWGKTILRQSSFEPSLAPTTGAMKTTTAGPGAILTAAPFHYRDLANPSAVGPSGMLGKPHGVPDDPAALAKALDDAERTLTRAEDYTQLENLQMRYGYYLATLEWDRLANLFASDGTIEIALRGMYVGHDSIRRSLNLYGEPGVHEGNLHNHMQFQPVIHVSEDGKTARLRARALSMMGNYEKAGMWMGGIYENQFVKENGVWKFQHDQVFNTYFTPFDQGWKDLQPRPPPGITATNPPDRPPTVQFEMYPKATIWPPYHYPNPVTGQTVSITGH